MNLSESDMNLHGEMIAALPRLNPPCSSLLSPPHPYGYIDPLSQSSSEGSPGQYSGLYAQQSTSSPHETPTYALNGFTGLSGGQISSSPHSSASTLSPLPVLGGANESPSSETLAAASSPFQEAASVKVATKRSRIRPVLYHSQISPGLDGIKLKIKKSPTLEAPAEKATTGSKRVRWSKLPDTPGKAPRRGKQSQGPGRPRKKRKKKDADSEDNASDEEAFRSKEVHGSAENAFCQAEKGEELTEQSVWASERMPPEVLSQIFLHVTKTEGCIPTLVRFSKVCRLWWQVAASPLLWHTADLSTGRVKEKHRTERKLLWLLNNRLTRVKELNLGGWNSALTRAALERLAESCPDLVSLSVTGCKGVHAETMQMLVQRSANLRKLDLSGVSPYSANPRGIISSLVLCEIAKTMGERLTHLNLANNCTTGLTQILTAIASSCPKLVFLDISNMRTQTRDVVSLPLELLQTGCPHLQVLRLTNSLFRLSGTPLKDQAAAPGFPCLEELSIAVDAKSYTLGLDGSSLERIVKVSNRLRLLDVRGCGSISSSSLVRVPAWDLEHLFLSGCSATRQSNDSLELVVRKWKHSLTEVDLSWTSATESLDAAVSALAEETNTSLKVLDLCGSSVSFGPVRNVLTRCTNLRTLNLSSCRALPRGIKRLYQGAAEVNTLRASIEAGRFQESNEDEDG